MGFSWSKRWEDDRNRTTVISGHLYMYHYPDAEYGDGDITTLVDLGGCRREKDGTWKAWVAYSMRDRETDSKYYGEQSATRDILETFDSFDAAASAIEHRANQYLTKMANEVLTFTEKTR